MTASTIETGPNGVLKTTYRCEPCDIEIDQLHKADWGRAS